MAAVITYAYPVASTVPPTALQASQVQTVTGVVAWLDADTTALFTHNFGLGTVAPAFPNTAQLFPEVIIYQQAAGTAAPAIQAVLTSGNVITLGKSSIVGTGGTVVVIARRPHTVGM